MDDRNIVLTGVPRSGTTLTCHLLNKLADVVALHEPMTFKQFETPRQACVGIGDFFDATRKSIIESGEALSNQIGGRVPDNPVIDQSPAGLAGAKRQPANPAPRKNVATRETIRIEKTLSEDFALCIKQPSAFTALLKHLVHDYPCYAVVRNPLAVLGSWNSVTWGVKRGRAPAAERFDADLTASLDKLTDAFERQLHLLSWFFETYHAALLPEQVLRYENIVESGGKACQVIVHGAAELDETLENRNASKLYDRDLTLRMGERLLRTNGAFWEFYSRSSVEALLDEPE